jgi:hypothetical protein
MAQYASVHTFIPDSEEAQESEGEEGDDYDDDSVEEEIEADVPPSNAGSAEIPLADIPSSSTA